MSEARPRPAGRWPDHGESSVMSRSAGVPGPVRMNPVVPAGVLLAGALVTGCSTVATPRTTASATGSASPSFHPGEIRAVPDPRTLLSSKVREELRYADGKGTECDKDKADTSTLAAERRGRAWLVASDLERA